MKKNELRIGNYVEIDQYPNDRIITEIENGIDIDGCIKLNPKAIPLTEEWLVKFKFEGLEKDCRTFFRTFFKNGKFKVELSNGGNVYYNRNIFISSVHQLQNLYFALTGEELILESE